jgi:hypothetical protein
VTTVYSVVASCLPPNHQIDERHRDTEKQGEQPGRQGMRTILHGLDRFLSDGRRSTPGTEKVANERMLDSQHFCCRPAGDQSLIGEHGQTRRQAQPVSRDRASPSPP